MFIYEIAFPVAVDIYIYIYIHTHTGIYNRQHHEVKANCFICDIRSKRTKTVGTAKLRQIRFIYDFRSRRTGTVS
jgi:hypothetical protein